MSRLCKKQRTNIPGLVSRPIPKTLLNHWFWNGPRYWARVHSAGPGRPPLWLAKEWFPRTLGSLFLPPWGFGIFVTSALVKNQRRFWHCLLYDDELLDEHIDEKLFQGPYYCAVGAGNVSFHGFENRNKIISADNNIKPQMRFFIRRKRQLN